jgi:uncharacterized protein (TIGR02145 family)
MKKATTIINLFLSLIGFSQDLPFIKIGNQIWMQKNLENVIFRNEEVINEVNSKEDWLKAGYAKEPAWCYYNFDAKNANLGKLYNYYAVSDPRNIAPVGWRVPSFEDYYSLVKFLDPLCTKENFGRNGSLAGGSLKSKDSLWIRDTCLQLNSNFNAIPAGGYTPSLDYPDFDWAKKGEKAMFWCLTNWDSILDFCEPSSLEKFKSNIQSGKLKDKAIVIRLDFIDCYLDGDDDPKLYGYSLRLLKEN